MADKRVVVLTGAGTSRLLSNEPERPFPLMPDLCAALCDAMDEDEDRLAESAGLVRGMNGDEFEKAIGELLAWERVFPLTEKFIGFGGPDPMSHTGEVPEWLRRSQRRMKVFREALHHTLYSEFGFDRLHRNACARVLREMCEAVGIEPTGEQLFIATTNYDLAHELALDSLGATPRDGFESPSSLEMPRLTFDRSEPWETSDVTVCHLHGALGWYRGEDGYVTKKFGDEAYDERKQPALLYPDPDKKPESDPDVMVVWREFHRALSDATHVIVMGHSLHDRPMLTALDRCPPGVRILVTYYDQAEEEGMRKRLKAATSHDDAVFVPLTVAPGADWEYVEEKFARWAADDRMDEIRNELDPARTRANVSPADTA